MKKLLVFLFRLLGGLLKAFSAGVTLLSSLLFLAVFFLCLTLFFGSRPVAVPDGCALVLNPTGEIVERRSAMDPAARLTNRIAGIPVPEETVLQDILDCLREAAGDERIKLLVIDPSSLEQVSLDQLQVIGQAITRFKESGKQVISWASHYNQARYYLAAHADTVYLDPMGRVELTGMGLFRLYGRELLDKLQISLHTFRVGSYKSALEPFTRDSMSDEDREANRYWLTRLWHDYRDTVGLLRGTGGPEIDRIINTSDRLLEAAQGSTARMALQAGLVDGLKNEQEFRELAASLSGPDKKETGFLHVDLAGYMSTLTPSYSAREENNAKERIALIAASGNIIDGPRAPGQIGSRDLTNTIRQARMDDTVHALVLRIDSGGGSAFASEQIRQELLAARRDGKTVVISMGALAASGAYWLAADADAIVASPVTLTGSIGIFGAIPTFEKTLARVGVQSDGIATTRFGGGLDPTRPLSPELAGMIQLGVEEGYRQFIGIVANGRNLSVEQVEAMAQGRVWDGASAMELGLVDQLGFLEDAIALAAQIAGLKNFTAVWMDELDQPAAAQLLHQLRGSLAAFILGSWDKKPAALPLDPLVRELHRYHSLFATGDPAGRYAHSLLNKKSIVY